MPDPTELVHRYFRLAPSPDTEAYFAQFSSDAVAEDDGHEHRGIAAIRAWRHSVPPVTYTVRDLAADGDRQVARAEIAGDFPGSPVTLTFRFAFEGDGHIRRLAIAP